MLKHPPSSKFLRFLYENSLALVVTVFMLGTIATQAITGWDVWNQELEEMEMDQVDFWQYLGSGHFIEALFENREIEFL